MKERELWLSFKHLCGDVWRGPSTKQSWRRLGGQRAPRSSRLCGRDTGMELDILKNNECVYCVCLYSGSEYRLREWLKQYVSFSNAGGSTGEWVCDNVVLANIIVCL